MATRAKNKTKAEIFRILMLLEKNNMQVGKTAKELCIHRTLINKYRNRYWDEYVGKRSEVRTESLAIIQEKKEVLTEINNFRDDLGNLQNAAIAKLLEYLDTSTKKEPHLWLSIVKELAPYLVDKMSVSGANPLNDLDPVTRHTTFVQNIINKMEIKNGNSSY